MSVDKFKFVSPGIFIDEIDESHLPPLPERMGPLVIGRFEKGPAHRPVKVNSFREFVAKFGNPSAGNATSGDVWRTGELTAPTYAAYAVQAWLRNNSPCTVYRILGQEPSNADATGKARAGWITDATPDTTLASAGGAYGLFVMPNPDSYDPGSGLYAGAQDALDTSAGGGSGLAGSSTDHKIVINVPASMGGSAVDTSIFIDMNTTAHGDIVVSGFTSGSANQIGIAGGSAANDDLTDYLIAAINGTSNARIAYATGGGNAGIGTGIAGITAADGSNAYKVKITADKQGSGGNNTTLARPTGDIAVVAQTALTGGSGPAVTGTLAAVWYCQEGGVVLTGTMRDSTGQFGEGAGILVKGAAGNTTPTFTAKVKNGSGTVVKEATFNFDRDSKLFIRKVFNTDPTRTNSEIVNTSNDSSALKTHWLGETFESNLIEAENGKFKVTGSTPANSDVLGVILQLEKAGASSNIDWHDHRQVAQAARTGWFISQDTRGDTTSNFNPIQDTQILFRLHALGGSGETTDPGCGEASNRDLKISIESVKAPTDNFNNHGTFTLTVRAAQDTDSKPIVLERFSNLNLDPGSPNFIKRRIGDMNFTYDGTNKIVTEIGEYANRSDLVRVETSDVVDLGQAAGLLPFGVYGPSVPLTWTMTSGSVTGSAENGYAQGSGSLPTELCPYESHAAADVSMVYTNNVFTASIEFPTSRLRVSSSEGGLVQANKAYYGYQSSVKSSKRFDHSNYDLFRGQPAGHDPFAETSNESQYSWVFTLDDVERSHSDSKHSCWVSGSRALGNSWTADSGSLTGALDAGVDRFTSPMFGGFDGFDVTERDPLRNTYTSPGGTSGTETNNHAFYSLKKAVDVTSDAEYVEFDVVTMPGITNNTLNTALLDSCESRADSLAIIDLKGNYVPTHEHSSTATDSTYAGSVTSVINTFKDMSVNSSYGCTFYPFVRIRDTINDAVLYVPPSVVALGTFSSSQRKSAVWFAPAGFTRGGLSEGSAGLPVLGVKERVTATNRDKLYDANINPIASFPAEGIVIFGQKTLQVTRSALDRINVRRLLIYVKKEISRIASRILFDQNVQATWDRFTGQVVPFLEGVQAGLGLTDFRVVLDDTTTTPDLVDRNILYAKIFLKPARSIEFIALDFIVTRSGASFDD